MLSLWAITTAALLGLSLPMAREEAKQPILSKRIEIEDCRIEYRVYRKSEAGRILLAPYRLAKKHGIAHLVALDTDGNVLFHRTFEHLFRPMVLRDFKEIEPGYLGYFVSTLDDGGRWRSKYYFLDNAFQDVFLHPVPNYDSDLDGRGAVHVPRGNYFFLYSRRRRKAPGGLTGELQELDLRRNTPFTWNAEDYLASPRDRKGSLEIGSLAWDTAGGGGWLLGLTESREVVRIAYPGGDVLWRLSSRDWKFVGDLRNGFTSPRSVTRLANGNLLLIDAWDGGGARAVEYRLDERARTATLAWQFEIPGRAEEGDSTVQRLRGGNTLIARGSAVLEVTPEGQLAREWAFSGGYTAASAFFLPGQ